MSNISILIVEDEALIAEDISDIILGMGYDVASTISNGDMAIDYLMKHYPDLVICDIMIKGTRDGISIAEWLRKNRRIPFIFITSFSDKATIEKVKSTQPYGYIVKPFDERDITTTVELALYKFGKEMEQHTLTREKLNMLCSEEITNQEYNILIEMINGQNNEQICNKLFISINTLKFHIKNILSKFQASNRGEIMQKIIQEFIIKT